MKIIYFANNIVRENFGCRATSTALRQLLEKNNEIIADITGEITHENGAYNLFYSPLIKNYRLFSNIHNKKLIFKVWRKAARFINKNNKPSRYDFIDYNPEKSYKNLIKCLPANPQYSDYDLRKYDFDAIVINGEGTMIMSAPPRRDTFIYLMMAKWALDLNKKVYFVNTMLSDSTIGSQNKTMIKYTNDVLSKCTFVSVRDPYSLEYAHKYLSDVNAEYISDALFTWNKYLNPDLLKNSIDYFIPFGQEFKSNTLSGINFTKPYIVISGNSLVINNPNKAIDCYTKLVNFLKNRLDIQLVLLQVCSGDGFLKTVSKNTGVPCIPVEIPVIYGLNILAGASLYLSGRFHPSIMASLGGTPCVFQNSNSHKTNSLQQMLNYKECSVYSAFPEEKEFESILNEINSKINNKELIESIKKTVKELNSLSASLADIIK